MDKYEKTPGGVWRWRGDLQPIRLTNPAAGANLSFTLAGGGIYRFVALIMTLVNDANVANRFIEFQFQHGGLMLYRTQFAAAITASLTRALEVSDAVAGVFLGATTFQLSCPRNFFLPGGTTISTSILNIQVGDQLSDISLYVEFYPDAGEY